MTTTRREDNSSIVLLDLRKTNRSATTQVAELEKIIMQEIDDYFTYINTLLTENPENINMDNIKHVIYETVKNLEQYAANPGINAHRHHSAINMLCYLDVKCNELINLDFKINLLQILKQIKVEYMAKYEALREPQLYTDRSIIPMENEEFNQYIFLGPRSAFVRGRHFVVDIFEIIIETYIHNNNTHVIGTIVILPKLSISSVNNIISQINDVTQIHQYLIQQDAKFINYLNNAYLPIRNKTNITYGFPNTISTPVISIIHYTVRSPDDTYYDAELNSSEEQLTEKITKHCIQLAKIFRRIRLFTGDPAVPLNMEQIITEANQEPDNVGLTI
ncbi:MAG: hypothetical protein WBK76_00605 [Candidatus Saccharimonadales bacterium]